MSEYLFPAGIRDVIKSALPQEPAVFDQAPDLRYTFAPSGHARALHPDAMLVEGIRGSGKSFWWTVLQFPEHRKMVAHLLPKSNISEQTIVSVGFGQNPKPDDYPGKDNLFKLCTQFGPRQIWRTIVLRQVAKNTKKMRDLYEYSWPEVIKWVVDQPEKVERLLYNADQELNQTETHHLVLFDALDRTADDWPGMLKLIRGLLQVLLEFRSYKRIRPKAFLRPDHLEDTKAADFPDSSKLLTQKVELRWPRNELYGLLWQYLANEPKKGRLFREGCQNIFNLSWGQYKGIWTVPDNLRLNEEAQREVFHSITGPWMGRDRRRGFPYTWLPNHLGDAGGQVSPRSFLAAILHAAEDNSRTDYSFPLYYESLKKGVQEASRIRVKEMQEDYPWVEMLMGPLKGITVPCRFEEITRHWNEKVLNRINNDIKNKAVKLPPAHWGEGPEGIRRDLEALGVFERMTDDRVNLPDVYRVGYGLGRRGGVRAVAKG